MAKQQGKMELLAPAGGWDQLRAAVGFGADAVYLAGPEYGMRAKASNFKLDELSRAVDYAHGFDVDVHVTCNILMHEADLLALPSYFEHIAQSGADALIIGDLGALALARRYAPGCKLHVSTQASVANSEAAKIWHSMGASRIVCAREMTLSEISKMRKNIPDDLEIEVFVHGAQCMAVSGRCLISSYLTGRSGNRGDCTQPCRWSYSLVEETRQGEFMEVDESENGTLLMNAMDLNMIGHLHELIEAGVDSIKIEGRNKKAFYVATVVNAYRQALDRLDAQLRSGMKAATDVSDLQSELQDISHRPYSEGFFFGNPKQAVDYDGYEQETLHIADVLSCEECPEGDYRITFRCRNRMSQGDILEVLSPNESVRTMTIENIEHIGTLDADGKLDRRGALGIVDVSNRTSDVYSTSSPFPIEAGSFLRYRTHRRTSRSL